jgi:predicted Zn finger-like uncharacterized protein
MKHTCEHCTQRYDIPDEKVLGKILKVRCKTCSGVMSVMGPHENVKEDAEGDYRPPTLTGVQAYRASEDGEALPASGRVWWCGIGGRAHGPFMERELERLVDRGEVHARTRMWRSGMSSWARISESPNLGWMMETIMRRTAEDKDLLHGRDPSCVFDRAGLSSDGKGYFPNPTLKSGWLVLDEETQNYLENCAKEASWYKEGSKGVVPPPKTPRTNLMLRAALMGATGAVVFSMVIQFFVGTTLVIDLEPEGTRDTVTEERDIQESDTLENAFAALLP